MKIKLYIFCVLCCLCLPVAVYAQNTEDNTDINNNAEINQGTESNTTDEQSQKFNNEPEVIYESEKVFSSSFMKNLLLCKIDEETDGEKKVNIMGMKGNTCLIRYANFELNVPQTLLGNIHGFDDLELLLKNKDIAHYNYRADYVYDGIVYALNACFNRKNYDGNQEELTDEYVLINRGLYAEFMNDICVIYLVNQQNVEGVTTDYGVTCKLPYKEVTRLEEYFKDLVNKYGEKRKIGSDGHIFVQQEQKNTKTKEADIALMYYLQQNNYCQKNKQ